MTTEQPPPAPLSLEDAYDKYIELRREKDRIEETLKPINDEITRVEGALINAMTTSNTESLRRGGFSVSLRREIYARPAPNVDRHDLALAMSRSPHTKHLLTVNAQSLSAWARELMTDGDGNVIRNPRKIPQRLRPLLQVDERVTLQRRKAV